VAIHGLNGDAFKTWTTTEYDSRSNSAQINWLSHPDLLPRYLPTARILTWGYNANISSMKGKQTSSDRILQHAQTLVAQLSADREVSDFVPIFSFLLEYFMKGLLLLTSAVYIVA
jgi:hypothetical protein